MLRSDFNYHLPPELIAQRPAEERSGSRLLVVNGPGRDLADRRFADLPEYLTPDDLLVVNDTQVIPARVFGRKPSGGRVQLLIERITAPGVALCHLKASKKPAPGSSIDLDGGVTARIGPRHGELFEIAFDYADGVLAYLQAHGHVPLPPYIARSDGDEDRHRYQTVYASRPGAVAAPTAGLHFDRAMLDRLEASGVGRASVTLHVGAGTFQPVRADAIESHRMHAEWLEVSESACARIEATRQAGGRVVAVGTTVVRALETAAGDGRLRPYRGETDIFISPGHRFRSVDALLTNFHLPESTLLMLVCAFGGYERLMAAYRHAVQAGYRFFSYGDAMLLYPAPGGSGP